MEQFQFPQSIKDFLFFTNCCQTGEYNRQYLIICHCGDSSCGELISPCYCSGSMRYVHQVCLQHWIRASNNKACELCRYPYCMRTKLRPFCYWESLPMSISEKRRLFCSAVFHSIALGCVIWSLYVLIDRTVDELYQSELEWQFWTKIVVEAIGCLGAGILVYVWGKSYFTILNKWIAFNRTFIIVSSSPPPIKKPLPVDTKPPSQPSAQQIVVSEVGPGSLCHPGPDPSLSVSSPPIVTTMMMGPQANLNGSGHHGGASLSLCRGEESNISNNICHSEKAREAREGKPLLLPPVVYSPPPQHQLQHQQQLQDPPSHLQNP